MDNIEGDDPERYTSPIYTSWESSPLFRCISATEQEAESWIRYSTDLHPLYQKYNDCIPPLLDIYGILAILLTGVNHGLHILIGRIKRIRTAGSKLETATRTTLLDKVDTGLFHISNGSV